MYIHMCVYTWAVYRPTIMFVVYHNSGKYI